MWCAKFSVVYRFYAKFCLIVSNPRSLGPVRQQHFYYVRISELPRHPPPALSPSPSRIAADTRRATSHASACHTCRRSQVLDLFTQIAINLLCLVCASSTQYRRRRNPPPPLIPRATTAAVGGRL